MEIFYDIYGNEMSTLFQWDINRTIYVNVWGISKSVFSSDKKTFPAYISNEDGNSYCITGIISDDGSEVRITIPNILLQSDATMHVWYRIAGVYYRIADIPIKKRPKPENYEVMRDFELITGTTLEVATLEETKAYIGVWW